MSFMEDKCYLLVLPSVELDVDSRTNLPAEEQRPSIGQVLTKFRIPTAHSL